MNELEQNTAIRELFTQSTHRALGTFATIDYEGQSGVNKYYLSGKTPESSLEKSLRIEVDTTVMRENVSYIGFNWVGLAYPKRTRLPVSVGIKQQIRQWNLKSLLLKPLSLLSKA